MKTTLLNNLSPRKETPSSRLEEVSIYPKEIIFEDVQINNFYEINLFVRNQTKENKKIRLLHPTSDSFKVKYESTQKYLAAGLSLKVSVIFCQDKIKNEKVFQDCIQVIGDNFCTKVQLKAYTPQQHFQIPKIVNVGKIIASKEHISKIIIKNVGKMLGVLKINQPTNSMISIPKNELQIEGSMSEKLEIRIKTRNVGEFQEILSFSNGCQCIIRGVIIEQAMDLIDENGMKLQFKDLGQILIGEERREKFFMVNNTSSKTECLLKIFHKQMQSSDIRVDQSKNNFIIKTSPKQYTDELNKCHSKVLIEKTILDQFSDIQNEIVTSRIPSESETKQFLHFCYGSKNQQLKEQPFQETLLVKFDDHKGFYKIPINFSFILPKIKLNRTSIDLGEILERNTVAQTFTIENISDRNIKIQFPSTEQCKIQGSFNLISKNTHLYKITYRPVKPGKITETLKIKVLDHFNFDIKIFGICRSAKTLVKTQTFMNNSKYSRSFLSDNLSNYTQINSIQMTSEKLQRKQIFNKIKLNKIEIQAEKQNQTLLKEPKTIINIEPSCFFFKKQEFIQAVKSKKSKNMFHPLNLKEITKFSEELSLKQLSKIEISSKELIFGNVFIGSESIKQITIQNKNEKSILFELDTNNHQALSETLSDPLRIEGFSKINLPIILKPRSVGALQIPISYLINRQHAFQIQVAAFVTLVNLELSTKNVQITFQDKQLSFEKKEDINIFNYGNTPIHCTFKNNQNKNFHISCQEAYFPPKSSKTIQIIYRPIEGDDFSGQERVDAEKIIIKIAGGAENIIKCIGTIVEPKVTVKENQFIFPSILASVELLCRINMKNITKKDTVYKIQLSKELEEYISINKEICLLNSQQKKQILFTFCCKDIKKITGSIFIHFRAGKTVKIPVEANVIYPEVTLNKNIIDFGLVPKQNASHLQNLSLSNKTKSQIKIQLAKFFETQDFIVEMQEINKNFGNDEDFSEIVEPRLLKKKSTVYSLNQGKDRQKDRQKDRKVGAATNPNILKLLPFSETSISVKFTPKKLRLYEVTIPLKISETLQVFEVATLSLKCQAIQPILYLSAEKIFFETKIINEVKSSYIKEFKILNPHDFEIDWKIEPLECEKCSNYFYLSDLKGKLQAKSSAAVEVIFKPQSQGNFIQNFNIIVKEKKISIVNFSIEGSAIMPSIKFNCNEVIMPTVPLNTESKGILILQNHGYDAITICKWKTSNHFQFVDLKVNFVEGKLLSLAKKQLKVQVSFCCLVAISFTTMLQFYDQYGNKYELPLSATADNCTFTTYPFLESDSQHNILYDSKENMIKLLTCGKIIASENKNEITGNTHLSCQFIKNWLNYEINLKITSFPNCLIQSEGDLFQKMVNRMSTMVLIKKMDSSQEDKHIFLYNLYSESIKSIKMQGGFLNQIRPQVLLGYGDYRKHLESKKLLVENEDDYEIISIEAWTCLFYQLCKLYVLPQISDKVVSRFVTNQSILPTSTLYSPTETLIFQFLNSFLIDQSIYNLNDQVKLYQTIQKSLEKCFHLSLSASLLALKASVAIMSPHVFLSLISKFLFQKLKQFGLSLFLTPNDLFTMGTKEIFLFLISYIKMLYHYTNLTPMNFEASIGDKITKIIEIDNPSTKKMKYLIKVIGSEDFLPERRELQIFPKGKAQLRVLYHCKINKEEEGTLLLIPEKEDDTCASIQPLAFKLQTSILSKIVLKKINISTCLYQITNVPLQIELPIEINEITEFTVTLNEVREGETPSFLCFQSLTRNLKNNHDKIDIKLLALNQQDKICKISYKSAIFGEFIYEIHAKVQLPYILREYKLRQLKVNKEETVSVVLAKENEQLQYAYKFMTDHHYKLDAIASKTSLSQSSKYSVSILESNFISIHKDSLEVTKSSLDGKDGIRIDLNCNFYKPYQQYTCTLLLRNQLLKDVRLYKLSVSVANKPKVVYLEFKIPARESIMQKIPIKFAPCQVTVQTLCPYFSIANYTKQIKQNTDIMAVFSPTWMTQSEAEVIIEDKETLEKVIYNIALKAQEPAAFDQIKVQGYMFFTRNVKIPLKINAITESFTIKQSSSKRGKIIKSNLSEQSEKYVELQIKPSSQKDHSIVKFYSKQNENQYFWMDISIENKQPTYLTPIHFRQKILTQKQYVIEELLIKKDDEVEINFEEEKWIKHNLVSVSENQKKIELDFRPFKELEIKKKLFVLLNKKQYQIDIFCKVSEYTPVIIPQISSHNLKPKTTSMNLINSTELKGVYRLQIIPAGHFTVEHHLIEMKPRQKRQIKIVFHPEYLQLKHKAKIIFESDSLPNYEYQLCGCSEYLPFFQDQEFQCYEGVDSIKQILFANHFAKKQDFIIEENFKHSSFRLADQNSFKFSLEPKQTKRIIIIGNVHNQLSQNQMNRHLIVRNGQKSWSYKLTPLIIKNFNEKKYVWSCKSREAICQNLDVPSGFKLKYLQSQEDIKPYLSYTLDETHANQIKLKFNPLKPLKKRQEQIVLIGEKCKYVLNCFISVIEPDFDDTISIKTKETNEIGCISFRLTNINKQSAPFKAYFVKGCQELAVEYDQKVLEGYGRPGTTIIVKFTSNIYNKKVEDSLVIETDEMYWLFKVKGQLSKIMKN